MPGAERLQSQMVHFLSEILSAPTVSAIGFGIYQAAQAPTISIPKAKEKAEAIPVSPPTPTVIDRYGDKSRKFNTESKGYVFRIVILHYSNARCGNTNH